MNRIQYFLQLATFMLLGVNLFSQTILLQNSTLTQQQVFTNIDSLIIRNCEFIGITGEAVRFDKIGYVEISDCTFEGINNNVATRAVICGKASQRVVLKKLEFQHIIGTAIRIPTDGASALGDRVNSVHIDSVSIYDCQSTASQLGDGIRVFHTDTLLVSNSLIRLVDNLGINIGRNSSNLQNSQKVKYCHLYRNLIDSVLSDGIGSQENIDFARVEHNTITHIAYDGIGARPAHGDHGIYWQAPNAIIKNNFIAENADGTISGHPGSGISLRTNAIITNNLISHCTGNGIGYFNDHRASGNTFIANNVIHHCESIGIYHNGSNGNILDPNAVKHPDSVFIYHNTVLNEPLQTPIHLSSPVAFNSMSSRNFLAGNLLIFEAVNDTNKHIFVTNTPHFLRAHNLLASGDIQFEDYPNQNYRLTASSPATDYLPVGISYVSHDLLDSLRNEPHDAGAYEFIPTLNGLNHLAAENILIQLFPNPSHRYIRFSSSQEVQALNLFDMSGRLIGRKTVMCRAGELDLFEQKGQMIVIQFLLKNGQSFSRKVLIE